MRNELPGLIIRGKGVKQQRRTETIAKILILTFNDDEEKAIEKVLSVLSDEIGLEAVKPVTSSVRSFPGLEIKLYQRRVFRDGEDAPLTRLEYGTLAYQKRFPVFCARFCQMLLRKHEKIFRGTLPYFFPVRSTFIRVRN